MQKQREIPKPLEQVPLDLKPTEEAQKTDVGATIDQINTLTQEEILYTCGNRFAAHMSGSGAIPRGHQEGRCFCSHDRGIVLKDKLHENPIRCDKAGNPLPGAKGEKSGR